MFKREKRMHSFIIRAQEILADGKREESAKMVIQGLQHYSNKIIGAIQPYSKADATLLVIALRYLADQVEQKNGCALAVKALSKTIEFPELEEVEKVKKATGDWENEAKKSACGHCHNYRIDVYRMRKN